jgi:hypothetical protein
MRRLGRYFFLDKNMSKGPERCGERVAEFQD